MILVRENKCQRTIKNVGSTFDVFNEPKTDQTTTRIHIIIRYRLCHEIRFPKLSFFFIYRLSLIYLNRIRNQS